ncbi:tetratricopeptide repeat protein [Colwellia sp. MB3u-4]|uniref:tetratricopeptide repeat protein n=1 Tax=Colwellia sp. MB3u-4 TaxID=2759822 RepID=UPI0015F7044B|nr:tetratricopeptide repeat protein [Colwellia sp. MB3u-4]MBA6289036.1 tetratricopeptide repeat protein [Colwellia sp. MB3u-4]
MNNNNELHDVIDVSRRILKSGDLSISIINQQVYFQGKPLVLPNLSYQLLVDLMMHWPKTRTQDELIQSIWGKVQVQNSTLNQRVKLLRQALKEQGGESKSIALVRGVGYRFAEEVIISQENELVKDNKVREKNTAIEKASKPVNIIKKNGFKILTALVVILGLSSTLLQRTTQTEKAQVKQSLPVDKQRKSITVAPFISSSYANTTDDYLANSFSAEISSSLAEVSGFQVVTYNKSPQPQLISLTNQEMGRKLQVDNILTGKIERIESGFNVDIQLLSTNTNEILWAQNYHVSTSELYFLKFDIAQGIKAHLFPNNIQPVKYRTDPSLVNPKAYDFYLQAMDYQRRNSKRANLNAQTLIKRAYELSPNCLDIISGYAAVINSGISLGEETDSSMTKAISLANKAIDLYPNNFRGYVELANSSLLQQDDKMALKYFKQALLLSPENVAGLIGLAKIQIKSRKFKKVLANIELLKILHPSSTNSLLLSGDVYSALELYAQAQQDYESIIKVEPDNIDAMIGLAKINIKQENFDNAKKYYQSIHEISPDSPQSLYILLELLFFQQHYPQLIKQVELSQYDHKKGIYNTEIGELKTLAQLLVNPVENTYEIAKKISHYQAVMLDDEASVDKFNYLFALLEAVGKTVELENWKSMKSKYIDDGQKNIL